ncbi:MAG: UDP-N-acetylglucosamine 2-epimerase [Oligoflexales bacterium]
MRKILYVTGIRSDFDVLFPALKVLNEDPEVDLGLAVTGAHLSSTFGRSVEVIEAEGFKIIEKIESLIHGDTRSAQLKGSALQILGLTQVVESWKPDLLLTLGDREESLVTAMTGTYLGVPVGHICGGDRSGNIDDMVRHSVSKLSQLHLVTHEDSRNRLLRMGESDDRIHVVGNPALEKFVDTPDMTREEVFRSCNLDVGSQQQPLLVVLHHTSSWRQNSAREDAEEVLRAVRRDSHPCVVIYPNSDPGAQDVIKAIESEESNGTFSVARNLPREVFVNLLKQASCLVGNSSAGCLEAPFIELPVVNVGDRQRGRIHGQAFIDVDYCSEDIYAAVRKACFDPSFRKLTQDSKYIYGDAKTSQKILNILKSQVIDERFCLKYFE